MSEAGRHHVMRHLAGNQCEPPADPQRFIENSTTSLADGATLSPTQRNLKERRAREGKNVKGSFDKLKARVDAAQANGGEGPMVRALDHDTELDQPALIAQVRSIKVENVDMTKALAPAFDKARAAAKALLKSDAPAGATSLEAGYNPDSATQTQGNALRVPSLQTAKRKPTNGELLKAGSNALNAGKITAAEAMHLEYACNMGKDPDEAIVGKLGLDK